MIPLLKLKKDVQFNGELTKVVDVLKGIAAARYFVLERQLALFEQFFKVAGGMLEMIDVERAAHPYVRPSSPVVGAVVVTSDGGFLGGLNTQVVNAGLRECKANGLVTVIGERGAGYLSDQRRDCTTFPGIEDNRRMELAMAVRDHVVEQILTGQCGRIVVAYPKPVSFSVQEITVETILPCTGWLKRGAASSVPPETIWESRTEDVLEYLVTLWIGHRLNEIFAMSRLAELSARAVHMEGSFQELQRRGKALKQQYFRARHEVIDRSMREIFAAQLLYRRAGEEEG